MTIGDKILVVLVVIATVFITVLIFVSSPTVVPGKNTAVVNFQGKKYGRYLLDEDKIISISENIKLEISSNRIRVPENNCPQGICVHRGWIYKSGQIICCVPNKLLIEIVSREKIYDGLTY